VAITMFEYIASNNPQGAEAIASSYGYTMSNITTPEDIAACLMELVDAEGEPVLRDLASIHPDKDLILENIGSAGASNGGGCGCGFCKQKATQQYTDQAKTKNGKTNSFQMYDPAVMLIVGGTILLVGAMIIKN